MAGVFGKISREKVAWADLEPMSRALIHRGPDDEGFRLSGNVGIGCRRLAVMDLAGGRQPISNEDGTIWVVCDGELYNHNDLRVSLEKEGHVFRTKSDAEVVVHLYEDCGEGFVGKLRGMFALAVWDERQSQLILARDKLGQKPLFYSLDGERLVFASEMKALLATGEIAPEVDYEALNHFLSLRFVPAPLSMIRGICKVPPAHILVHQKGRTEIRRYWDLSFRQKIDLPEGQLIDGVREKFREVVASHFMGNVPGGAFLSGGLDSGLIVAMISKHLGKSFPTFSVGVDNPEFNELPFAREVSQRFATQHFEVNGQTNLIQMLPVMIRSLDEPSDPVAASKFLASRLASGHVKFVLGGDGGDELFAGFDRYFGVGLAQYYAKVPSVLRQRLIGPLIDRIPSSYGYESIAQKLRWMQRLAGVHGNDRRFAEAVSFFRFNHQEKENLLSDAIWSEIKHSDSATLLQEQYARCDAEDPVEKMLYTDYMMRLPEHSLMLTDRMGMAHSVEVRSPFVDHELVEYLAAFPLSLKIRGRQRKYVERRIAQTELPPGFAERKKRGFRFPLAAWFGGELHPFLQRFFAHSPFVDQGGFRKKTVLRLLEEHRTRQVDHHIRIWMLINLEIWHAMVIQGRDPHEVTEKIRSFL